MQTSILRNRALQPRLTRDGFVQLPLLDAAEVDALLHTLKTIRDRASRSSTITGQALAYHATALDGDAQYRESIFSAVRDAVAPKLEGLLDDFDIITAGLIIKEPGTGALSLHSDWTLTEDIDQPTLTVWCPLVDVDDHNGCLRVVPGSHRLVRQIRGPGIKNYHAHFQKSLGDIVLSLPMRAGEGLIFDSSLLHGSPINESGVPRPAIMVSCVRKGVRPVFYRHEDGPAQQDFEIYALSDGAFKEHSAHDYFAGLVPDRFISRIPDRNGPVSHPGFRRRHLLARWWRRLTGRYEPRWLFEALPGFR